MRCLTTRTRASTWFALREIGHSIDSIEVVSDLDLPSLETSFRLRRLLVRSSRKGRWVSDVG